MSYSRRSRYESNSRSPYHDGRSVSRSLSRSRSRSRSSDSGDVENPGNNLYVTGLPSRVTKDELERHFASEGKVTDVHLVVDPWTRESRGFGFVSMDTLEDAERCIKYLDQSVLGGRVITVEKARRRRGRTPTPGRYLGLRTAPVRRRSPSYSPHYRGRYRSPSYSPHYRRRYRSPSYSPYYRRRYRSPSYYSERDRSYSPSYRRHRSRSWSRSSRRYSRSPIRRRGRSYSRDSRSYSPVRSISPSYRRRYYRSVSRSLSPRRSVSPGARRSYSRSVSPRSKRRSRRSYSRSVSPRYKRRSRSYSRSVSPNYTRNSHTYSPKARRSKRSPSDFVLPTRSKGRHSRESYAHSRSLSSSRSPVRSR